MLERVVEQSVGRLVKAHGGRYFKWVSPGYTGVPDRICIFPGGRIIFVELKRPGLKDGRSERQKKVARILEDLGCTVWRIGSLEEMKARLNEI